MGDSSTGEPTSDLSLVKSLWLCVEDKRWGSVGEAGESEEAGLCVEKSGLGTSSPTPHWTWLSGLGCLEPGQGIQLGLSLGSYWIHPCSGAEQGGQEEMGFQSTLLSSLSAHPSPHPSDPSNTHAGSLS